MIKLTKEMILAAADCKSVDVEVPEWEGTVTILEMNGVQRGKYEEQLSASAIQEDGTTKVRLATMRRVLLPMVLADCETHALLFTEEDVDALEAKNGAVLSRLFEKAVHINALLPEKIEKN